MLYRLELLIQHFGNLLNLRRLHFERSDIDATFNFDLLVPRNWILNVTFNFKIWLLIAMLNAIFNLLYFKIWLSMTTFNCLCKIMGWQLQQSILYSTDAWIESVTFKLCQKFEWLVLIFNMWNYTGGRTRTVHTRKLFILKLALYKREKRLHMRGWLPWKLAKHCKHFDWMLQSSSRQNIFMILSWWQRTLHLCRSHLKTHWKPVAKPGHRQCLGTAHVSENFQCRDCGHAPLEKPLPER